ncbi:MAG: AAA family ATPase, partial [Opitutales bacterium]
MIESIAVADVATFASSPETLDRLSKFNFVFGSNGSGKTTISRIIADEGSHPTCKVTWKSGTKLQAMVYNRDFVERNFNPSTELKGVFTLGEKQAENLAKIATAKEDLDRLTAKIGNLTGSLRGNDGTGGKEGELATLEAGLKDKCWAQKQMHDAKLQGAFEGFRGNAEKFKAKVLQELAVNAASIQTLPDLEKKAASIFGPTPVIEKGVTQIDAAKLIGHEENAILKKRVIGKEDVDIAAMIKRLGSSDWVREGRTFFDANERVCPFCQQTTEAAFARSLDKYFDETFLRDSKAIETLVTDYSTDAARLQQEIESIIASPSKFLDVEKLKTEKERLDSKVTINLQRLAEKKKEASRVVELESLSNIVAAIQSLTDGANKEVREHNAMVANLAEERRTLTAQVWKFVLEELKSDLATYQIAREGLNKAITGITDQIRTATEDKNKKAAKIRDLERQMTSVQPTIDAVNALLSSFGFQSFSLAKAAKGTSYKLVRPDGSDAQATLSEGEKAFVTFLYFYHLLKGSNSET